MFLNDILNEWKWRQWKDGTEGIKSNACTKSGYFIIMHACMIWEAALPAQRWSPDQLCCFQMLRKKLPLPPCQFCRLAHQSSQSACQSQDLVSPGVGGQSAPGQHCMFRPFDSYWPISRWHYKPHCWSGRKSWFWGSMVRFEVSTFHFGRLTDQKAVW